MLPPTFPLRLLLTDSSERFQLRFADQATLLLADFSGVRTRPCATGLEIGSVTERDLYAAVEMIRTAFPHISIGKLTVNYADDGAAEPYVRVRVSTPEDFYGDIIAQLNERRGLIESMEDGGDQKIVTASAPLVELLGYDKILSKTTRGKALVDYEFLDYRRRTSEPPIPPESSAARA
jgi:translation elongation factor EF-G